MEKNEKEKQMLYEWGKANSWKYDFQQMDKSRESYFVQKQNNLYIREYAFETFPEFMKELNVLWKNNEMMEQIKRIIGVAALRNKPVKIERHSEEGQKETEDKLPAFIYNF